MFPKICLMLYCASVDWPENKSCLITLGLPTFGAKKRSPGLSMQPDTEKSCMKHLLLGKQNWKDNHRQHILIFISESNNRGISIVGKVTWNCTFTFVSFYLFQQTNNKKMSKVATFWQHNLWKTQQHINKNNFLWAVAMFSDTLFRLSNWSLCIIMEMSEPKTLLSRCKSCVPKTPFQSLIT